MCFDFSDVNPIKRIPRIESFEERVIHVRDRFSLGTLEKDFGNYVLEYGYVGVTPRKNSSIVIKPRGQFLSKQSQLVFFLNIRFHIWIKINGLNATYADESFF